MSEPTVNFSIQTQHAQFSVPSELTKRNFKSIQKLVEKQKRQITDAIAKLKDDKQLPHKMKLEIIKKLISNFESLQQKLEKYIKQDENYRGRLRARAAHLAELDSFTSSLPQNGENDTKEQDDLDKVLDFHNEGLINWHRQNVDLLVIDYLIKSNKQRDNNLGIQVLKNLEATSFPEIGQLIDYDVYENFNQVYLSINEDHDLGLVTAWFNENRNSLKRISSNLEFEINYCKYLSIIESGNVLEAVEYCKTNVAPYASEKSYGAHDIVNYQKNRLRLTEVGAPLVKWSAMASTVDNQAKLGSSPESFMLALSIAEYQKIQNISTEDNWKGLSRCFTEDFTKIYGLSSTYPMLVYLSAGISSLNTKSCYCNHKNTIFKSNSKESIALHLDQKSSRDLAMRGPELYYILLHKINQCPVCSPELFHLSQGLPYAQIITRIFDNPFKLPNGNIYPFDKLLNPSDKTEFEKVVRKGKVKDPLTKEIFFIDDCVRVFPA